MEGSGTVCVLSYLGRVLGTQSSLDCLQSSHLGLDEFGCADGFTESFAGVFPIVCKSTYNLPMEGDMYFYIRCGMPLLGVYCPYSIVRIRPGRPASKAIFESTNSLLLIWRGLNITFRKRNIIRCISKICSLIVNACVWH